MELPAIQFVIGLLVIAGLVSAYELKESLKPPVCPECPHCLARIERERHSKDEGFERMVGPFDRDRDQRPRR